MLLFKRKAGGVVAHVRQFAKAANEAQHEENAGISPHGHAGVALPLGPVACLTRDPAS